MRKWLLAMALVLVMASIGFGQNMGVPTSSAGTSATVQMVNGLRSSVTAHNVYKIECVRNGKVVWTEEIKNLVPTQGLNYLLDGAFKGSTPSLIKGVTSVWYIGLVGSRTGGDFAAGDTQASHANWVEVTAYTTQNGTTRASLTLGSSAASGSIDNSGAVASFTMNATTNVAGAFISDSATRGGTDGKMYGEGAFSSYRAVNANDVLNVTITLTVSASDAGFYLYEFLDHMAMLWEPVEDFRWRA